MQRALAILFAVLIAAPPVRAQDKTEEKDAGEAKKERRLTIPVPADLELDEATLEALQKGFQEEKERFLKSLIELHAQRVDYSRDSPRIILDKQRATRLAFQRRAAPRMLAQLDQAALMLNVVQIRNATAPRLSGRVLRVGEDEKYADLEGALADLKTGDKVLLGAGRHTWPMKRNRAALPSDIAIVGRARDSILVFQTRPIMGGQRLRLRDLTVEYPGRPIFQARANASLELIGCAFNNTAARGYAMYGSDAIVYAEDCVFDGDSEGTNRRSSAAVFRLYRDSILYVRRSRFLNYSRNIGVSQTGSVFEKIVIEGASAAAAGRLLAGRGLFTRGNTDRESAALDSPGAVSFERATDDPALIAAAAVGAGAEELDEESRRLLEVLKLPRNLGYWIGLLRHQDEKIRALAAERVQALSGQELRLTAGGQASQARRIEALIARLDSAEFRAREAASAELKGLGEAAREALEATRRSGTLEQQARADAILSELDAAALPQHELEWARLLSWLEENRDKLLWDQAAGRYRLAKD